MRVNMGEAGEMLFEDLEGLLREINEFCATVNKPEDIPQPLERYLTYVAKSGNTVFPWQHVRPLFRSKILQAMEQFPGELCPVNESFVMERFDLFRAAPFTIQRLTELITQPTRHYKKKEKFLRGLEKTVLVVSTVEPWSVDNDIKNGNESTSDGEMDQTYSENDDSAVNRTFTMDQQNILLAAGEVQGQSEVVLDHVTTTMVIMASEEMQGVETVANTTHSENLLDTVTTTMVTIISDESHSSSTPPHSENSVTSAPILLVEQISSEEQPLSSIEKSEPEELIPVVEPSLPGPSDCVVQASINDVNSEPMIEQPVNSTDTTQLSIEKSEPEELIPVVEPPLPGPSDCVQASINDVNSQQIIDEPVNSTDITQLASIEKSEPEELIPVVEPPLPGPSDCVQASINNDVNSEPMIEEPVNSTDITQLS